MDDGILTVAKMERINRVRLRYLNGLPVPASDLFELNVSVDAAGAAYVLGIYYDPKREPVVEGSWGPMFGPIIRLDAVSS